MTTDAAGFPIHLTETMTQLLLYSNDNMWSMISYIVIKDHAPPVVILS